MKKEDQLVNQLEEEESKLAHSQDVIRAQLQENEAQLKGMKTHFDDLKLSIKNEARYKERTKVLMNTLHQSRKQQQNLQSDNERLVALLEKKEKDLETSHERLKTLRRLVSEQAKWHLQLLSQKKGAINAKEETFDRLELAQRNRDSELQSELGEATTEYKDAVKALMADRELRRRQVKMLNRALHEKGSALEHAEARLRRRTKLTMEVSDKVVGELDKYSEAIQSKEAALRFLEKEHSAAVRRLHETESSLAVKTESFNKLRAMLHELSDEREKLRLKLEAVKGETESAHAHADKLKDRLERQARFPREMARELGQRIREKDQRIKVLAEQLHLTECDLVQKEDRFHDIKRQKNESRELNEKLLMLLEAAARKHQLLTQENETIRSNLEIRKSELDELKIAQSSLSKKKAVLDRLITAANSQEEMADGISTLQLGIAREEKQLLDGGISGKTRAAIQDSLNQLQHIASTQPHLQDRLKGIAEHLRDNLTELHSEILGKEKHLAIRMKHRLSLQQKVKAYRKIIDFVMLEKKRAVFVRNKLVHALPRMGRVLSEMRGRVEQKELLIDQLREGHHLEVKELREELHTQMKLAIEEHTKRELALKTELHVAAKRMGETHEELISTVKIALDERDKIIKKALTTLSKKSKATLDAIASAAGEGEADVAKAMTHDKDIAKYFDEQERDMMEKITSLSQKDIRSIIHSERALDQRADALSDIDIVRRKQYAEEGLVPHAPRKDVISHASDVFTETPAKPAVRRAAHSVTATVEEIVPLIEIAIQHEQDLNKIKTSLIGSGFSEPSVLAALEKMKKLNNL
ncbi:MAG: hypothetical protein ABIH34_00480 [Nanoarchaeota archaeon]